MEKSPIKNLMADAFASDKGMVACAVERLTPGGDVVQTGLTIAAVRGSRHAGTQRKLVNSWL